MMPTWWVVLRWRRRAVGDLLGHLTAQSTTAPSTAAAAVGAPNVGRIRLVGRLLAGFRDPLWESTLLAVVLRSQGWPASLVIGYEPVPTAAGRRLVPWVEIDGMPVSRSAPPTAFCPELLRYPPS